jgi:hypothetical protein
MTKVFIKRKILHIFFLFLKYRYSNTRIVSPFRLILENKVIFISDFRKSMIMQKCSITVKHSDNPSKSIWLITVREICTDKKINK